MIKFKIHLKNIKKYMKHISILLIQIMINFEKTFKQLFMLHHFRPKTKHFLHYQCHHYHTVFISP